MYDTARAALQQLTDHVLFERVAVKVLRTRFPELRITGPSGDLNRDAFGRPMFGERDEIVLLVSCEGDWPRKLKRDLSDYKPVAVHDRPEKAIFATNRSTKQTTQQTYKKWCYDTLRIRLEIVDLNELSLDLGTDELHRVAENDLGVRPRKPRVLQPVAAFRDKQKTWLLGTGAPLVGRVHEMAALREALSPPRQPSGAQVVIVEGPAGTGKTRLAVDAAQATATTLVAATGTAVSGDCLADVPLDTPSIVIVDDAHRSPDLSGIAAMLHDPRFSRVKVVLTVRAGSASGVLASIGQGGAAPLTVRLTGLDRSEIDQIVTGHGFTSEGFRSHVITVAQGSPWLAHAACQVASERPSYTWGDTAGLLNQLIDQRLQRMGTEPDEHRAAAVALALLTTVNGGEELAALAGAVTALPREPNRLDILLEDLLEAGIAVGPPYAICSDTVAPVLAAAALDPRARVKIKLSPVLQALGRGAILGLPGDPPSRDRCLLGIGPLRSHHDGRILVINDVRLAAQLSVLALAAYQRGDQATPGMLHRAVRELLPDDADIAVWLDILTLTGSVAPTAPGLLGDLRDALTCQWPPGPATVLWDDDPALRYRSDIETLLKQAITAGEQTGHRDANRAISWILECAWLCHPVLGSLVLGFAERAIRSLLRTRLRTTAQTWDQVFRQRQQVLDSVLRWGLDRCGGPPTGLSAAERALRDPAVAAHILLTALNPLLGVITEEYGYSRPDAPDTFVFSRCALPDDSRTTDILMAAADAASALLDQLDLQEPAARPVLQAIVRLPRKVRAEAARGLSDTQPLPDYAIQALNEAAARISEAVASHWHLLPLTVRYAAAESTVLPGGRPRRSLADLSKSGDPIAVAAITDTALEQLLTIVPIDHPCRVHGADSMEGETERRQARARHLAGNLSTDEAAKLLTLIDPAVASSDQYDCLPTFACTVGRNALAPETVLVRLQAGPIPAAHHVFSGLLQTWPQQALAWLTANVTTPHVAHLTFSIADDIPADHETALLDAITAGLAASRGTGQAQTDPAYPHRSRVSQTVTNKPDESDLLTLTNQFAGHLSWCRAHPKDRLTRLAMLSRNAPDRALPRILAAVERILGTPPGTQALASDDDQSLRHELVAVLARALIPADDIPYTEIPYDTASAAQALGRTAPAETAQLLLDRTLNAIHPVIPFQWEHLLTQTPADQREPLALAFQERIELHKAAWTPTSETETAALDVLSLLGHGTPGWTALLRGWADGAAADRARAASAVSRWWHDPIWQELVPLLIDAGIDEQAITRLRHGLLPIDDAIDALGVTSRLNTLQPLLDDTRAVIRQFATESAQTLRSFLPALPEQDP